MRCCVLLGLTGCVCCSHKDSLQAARIVAATRPAEEHVGWNWQQGGANAGGSAAYDGTFSPNRSALVPSAGRTRIQSPLYSSTYSDSIGVGRRPSSSPTLHPRYPNNPVSFDNGGAPLPVLENTLNKSLAQAIASLPAADNLLKGNVDLHGSYSRDYGHRGHHPLQRTAGLVGGPPAIHAGSITAGGAASAYPKAAPTHIHSFPSSSLIGPSGQKAGPHPIEGMNEYVQTGYNAVASSYGAAGTDGGAATSSPNPFLRGGPGASGARLVGDSISETATTRELFAGSTKRSRDIRVPGAGGFVPASDTNQLQLTGAQPVPSTKDNILAVFNHNMPGYTGHAPMASTNIRGPRTPRGKKRLNEGLVASLILDSMKV